MRLTKEQSAIIEGLEEAHKSLVIKRAQAKKRAQEIVNAELETAARIQSNLANDALDAGVRKSQIGLAMGTRDWNLINRVIDLTREEHEAKAEIVKPKSWWNFDEDALTVTLHEWGGGTTGWPEQTGEYVVQIIRSPHTGAWTLNPEQERPAAVSLTMYRVVLPIMNGEEVKAPTPDPVVADAPSLESYGYSAPHAWTPEDDEKDANEW